MVSCWIHKLRAALSGRIDDHAARCPVCRASDSADRLLEQRLRNAAPRAEAPFGFSHRVLSKTGRELPGAPEPSHNTSLLTLTATVGMLFIACFALIRHNLTRSHIPRGVVRVESSRNGHPAVLRTELPRISPAQIDSFSARLDQPLEKELHYMISDTRQAIQFVASNFIPDER